MEKIHPEGSRAALSTRWIFRAPLLVASALSVLITGGNIARLLRAEAPRNPWEASQVIEGWRSLRGMPVYDVSPDGHATHFYGVLAPWVQGEVFRWVGPNNVSGRLLTILSAIATIAVIAAATRAKGAVFLPMVFCAAMFGLNLRSGQYFVENRPDMTSILFATCAVVLMGSGLETGRRARVAIGTACLIVGFLFKQPAIIFAAVPPVALALRGRWPSRSDVLLAIAPLAAAVAAILALRLFWPAVYHYTIEVPGAYRIQWRMVPLRLWEVLLNSPLFLVMAGEWLAVDGGSMRRDIRLPWVAAVLAVSLSFGAVAHAKLGGTSNSMLPAMLGMLAFCALRLPGTLARLELSPASPCAGLMLGSFAAMLLLMSIFPPANFRDERSPWDAQYGLAIQAVSSLPGTVVCPEDPTIPMYAKAYAGRGLFIELDAHVVDGAWDRDIPGRVVGEMRGADFVVDLRNDTRSPAYDRLEEYLNEGALRRLGFVPVDDLLTGAPSYRIWRRPGPGPSTDASRTAWNIEDERAASRRPDR